MADNQFSSIFLKTNIGNLSLTASIGQGFLKDYPPEIITRESGFTHFHTQYEIFFVGEEPLVIETSEKEYTFRNSAFLIPPFLRHFVKTRVDTYCFCFEFKQNGSGTDVFYLLLC